MYGTGIIGMSMRSFARSSSRLDGWSVASPIALTWST